MVATSGVATAQEVLHVSTNTIVRRSTSDVVVTLLLTLEWLRWSSRRLAVKPSRHAQSRTWWHELVWHYVVAIVIWSRDDEGDDNSAVNRSVRTVGSFALMTSLFVGLRLVN
jgi:hypothetical protein